jgi:hypothetical protein
VNDDEEIVVYRERIVIYVHETNFTGISYNGVHRVALLVFCCATDINDITGAPIIFIYTLCAGFVAHAGGTITEQRLSERRI